MKSFLGHGVQHLAYTFDRPTHFVPPSLIALQTESLTTSTKSAAPHIRLLAEVDAEAHFLAEPIINSWVYYIHDAAKDENLSANSYLFYLDGKILKTMQTTQQLIIAMNQQQQVHYPWLKMLARSLGITKKVPIIVGNYYFAPIAGTTRQNTHWLGLHHLLEHRKLTSGTLLSFYNHQELLVPQSSLVIKKMIETTAQMQHACKKILERKIVQFLTPRALETPQNIVERYNYLHQNEIHFQSIEELMTQFIKAEALAMVKGLLGEGNPYYDELKKKVERG